MTRSATYLIIAMIFLLGCTSSPRYRSLETPARTKEKMILKGISRKTMMIASFYGEEFDGCLTANGEIFDMHGNSAAHKTLPFGTVLKITYPPTGKSVTVIVNDRGPFIPERELDLSYGAAKEIGLIGDGVGKVEVVVVKWGSMEPTEKTKGEK